MAASNSVNDVLAVLDDRLAAVSPDLLRSLVKGFAEALMSAEADAACGAGYRERSDSRVNSRKRRRRAGQALVSVVATSYLLGVSTRRVEKLVAQMGIAGLSKSQVSEMARALTPRWRRSDPARWAPAPRRSCGSTR